LDISGYHSGQGDQCRGKNREFFHAGGSLVEDPRIWQQEKEKNENFF
jgi:hypothetical protein